MNKSCFTVLYACYKCLQVALLMEEALIFIVKDHFFISMKKKKGWSDKKMLLVEITCIYCIKQLTSCKAVKKKKYDFNLQVNCYTIKKREKKTTLDFSSFELII